MSPLKNLSPDEKPREKLLELGAITLSDAELLAILIGSGSREMNAVELCRIILREYNYSLDNLAKATVEELQKFKGIGEAKAITIASALELSRRRKKSIIEEAQNITCSADIYNHMHSYLMDLNHEEFWITALDRKNKIIKTIKISSGGFHATVVDPKLIFKHALDNKASGLILIHNHPSNTLKPSQADIDITRKLKEGAKYLEINILDHVIYTNNGYFSFADENLL